MISFNVVPPSNMHTHTHTQSVTNILTFWLFDLCSDLHHMYILYFWSCYM